jgi:hypothetical protein
LPNDNPSFRSNRHPFDLIARGLMLRDGFQRQNDRRSVSESVPARLRDPSPATRARLSCRPGAPSSRVAGSAQLAVIDRPARLTQKPNDLTMAVATGPQRTVGNIGSQLFFLVTAPRDLVLRRAVLPGAAGPGAGVSAGHSNMLE